MSHRPKQVGASLQRAIQQVISRGLQDPRVRGLITVTEVRVSSDLRDATVLISVSPAEHETLTLHGVKSAAKHIRRQAGEIVRMRSLPTLHFKIDRSSKEHAAVIAAINRAVSELPQAGDDGNDDHPDAVEADAPAPATDEDSA
ncbi:MAG: 30S ribosome-binding factor RbfA [Phycisphaerales bacterium]